MTQALVAPAIGRQPFGPFDGAAQPAINASAQSAKAIFRITITKV